MQFLKTKIDTSMKKSLLLSILVMCLGVGTISAQRYLTEVFSTWDTVAEVTYATNITVIDPQAGPLPQDLKMDVYMPPSSDTQTERPVVMLAHSGSFLPPPLNGSCNGAKSDSVVVQMCRQLAKRGFVACAYGYRQGWNPTSSDQDERTGTLLNAAYRGIQDTWALVRFLRMTAADGNAYGIDTNRIISGGIGTGGYISLGVAFLDDYSEITLAKFIDFDTQLPYVDTNLSSNQYGTVNATLNIANHVGFKNEVAMAFHMGGAVGDSTWVEAGEIPVVSYHVPNDPFAPYDFGPVIVPTTGDFVVNVSGGQGVQRQQDVFNNNQPFTQFTYNDPYTLRADAINGGFRGFFPFIRPTPESGPWDYWDTVVWNVPVPGGGGATFNDQGFLTNPDMSEAKALLYIDSVLSYLTPRIVCATGLPECAQAVSVEEKLELGDVDVFPNPSSSLLYVSSNIAGNMINEVSLLDLQGRTVFHQDGLKATRYNFYHDQITSGLYFLKVNTEKGIVTRKVILE